MLRQVAARLQPRARAQGSRLLNTQSRFGAVKPQVPRRTMATVHIEGIHKEPTELDEITTLPNGLRVASEALPGSFSGVGVYVEAGSRFENESLRGVHGRKIPVRDMCRRIEALTVRDLQRVASMVMGGAVKNPGNGSGAPTVVVQEAQAYGVTSHTMSWDQIQDRIDGWKLGRRA
ncbi:hypothetical protein M440DRAFT_1392449 [Trichoderma longibrachiatum ATCC 18648]|uniref:Uncharacterized protein n=1 Tax=Trichoderma longibrachiatum ATCC 18648 TaxID=983965 RepID=A0A2T4C3A6_TRILO|nr:hypothetical protein M440DRAFT_1392449 [Trichoderma longibrachiatum ATCC 18648]